MNDNVYNNTYYIFICIICLFAVHVIRIVRLFAPADVHRDSLKYVCGRQNSNQIRYLVTIGGYLLLILNIYYHTN